MRYLLCLMIAMSFLVGCRKKAPQKVDYSIAVSEEVAYELEKLVAEIRSDNFDLNICHSRAYKTKHGDFRIWVNMYSQELLEVKDARHLMADLVAEILEGLNKHYYVTTATGKSQITVRDLYISVDFESFFGRFVDPLYVGRMELQNGYVTAYYAHTALDADSVIFHQFFEPYVTTAMLTRVDRRVEAEIESQTKKQDLADFLKSAQEFHQETIRHPDRDEMYREVPVQRAVPKAAARRAARRSQKYKNF